MNIASAARVKPSMTELYWKCPWSIRISAGWRRMEVVAIARSYLDIVVCGSRESVRVRRRRGGM